MGYSHNLVASLLLADDKRNFLISVRESVALLVEVPDSESAIKKSLQKYIIRFLQIGLMGFDVYIFARDGKINVKPESLAYSFPKNQFADSNK